MKLTIRLFDSIINTSQDCVFWKDKERRFLGVNQAFLDFYGFESADVLIGKTDEDVGWHSDPEPYKQDELRVLAGESTYKVQGKCLVHGEERDIIASKRPLYEGDEIVGLVGSFVDITDVIRRQNRSEGLQVVYTVENLRQYPYWDKLLDDTAIDEILDPLTGILSRPYAADFAHSLISNRTPFSLTILDLDNFKFINDSYGHLSGDIVLMDVTKSLAEYTEGYGLVSRFGGDELLLINLRDVTREDNEAFFRKLYDDCSVFRKNVEVTDGSVYVTCTCGSASYPADSKNYAELFELIDKTLYYGKNKGRNCYTVYKEEKHRDIAIKKLAKNSIHTDMMRLRKIIDSEEDMMKSIAAVMPYITETYQIPDLYFIDTDGNMSAVIDKEFSAQAGDIAKLMKEDLYVCSSLDGIKDISPLLYQVMKEKNNESFLAARVFGGKTEKGYLVCAARRRHRIWQESEFALFYFLSTIVRG